MVPNSQRLTPSLIPLGDAVAACGPELAAWPSRSPLSPKASAELAAVAATVRKLRRSVFNSSCMGSLALQLRSIGTRFDRLLAHAR